MSKLLIKGGKRLCGELYVQGAKNAALPILAATVLCRGKNIIHNCPNLSDVDAAIKILKHLGCKVEKENATLKIENTRLKDDNERLRRIINNDSTNSSLPPSLDENQ